MKKLLIIPVAFLCACSNAASSSSPAGSQPPSVSASPTTAPDNSAEVIEQFHNAMLEGRYADAYHIVHAQDVNAENKEIAELISGIDSIVFTTTNENYVSYNVTERTTYESSTVRYNSYNANCTLSYCEETNNSSEGGSYGTKTFFSYYPDTKVLKSVENQYFRNGTLYDSNLTEYDFMPETPAAEPVVTIDGNRRTEVLRMDFDGFSNISTKIYDGERLISDESRYIDHENNLESVALTTYTYNGNKLVKETLTRTSTGEPSLFTETKYLSFDVNDNPTKYVYTSSDWDGSTETEQYFDERGNKTYEKTQSYDGNGLPQGSATEVISEYDSADNLISYTCRNTPYGIAMTYTYDKYGRMLSSNVLNYENDILTFDQTTTYTYMPLD